MMVLTLSLILATLRTGVGPRTLVVVSLVGLVTLTLAAFVVKAVGSAFSPCVTCMARERALVGILDPIGVSIAIVVAIAVVVAVVAIGISVASSIAITVTVVVAGRCTIAVGVVPIVTATIVALALGALLLIAFIVLTLSFWHEGILGRLSVHVGADVLDNSVIH